MVICRKSAFAPPCFHHHACAVSCSLMRCPAPPPPPRPPSPLPLPSPYPSPSPCSLQTTHAPRPPHHQLGELALVVGGLQRVGRTVPPVVAKHGLGALVVGYGKTGGGGGVRGAGAGWSRQGRAGERVRASGREEGQGGMDGSAGMHVGEWIACCCMRHTAPARKRTDERRATMTRPLMAWAPASKPPRPPCHPPNTHIHPTHAHTTHTRAHASARTRAHTHAVRAHRHRHLLHDALSLLRGPQHLALLLHRQVAGRAAATRGRGRGVRVPSRPRPQGPRRGARPRARRRGHHRTHCAPQDHDHVQGVRGRGRSRAAGVCM